MARPTPEFRALLLLTRFVVAAFALASVAAVGLVPNVAFAQPRLPAVATVASAAGPAKLAAEDEESVAFDSPRASMTRFMAAADEERWSDAATFLDLGKGDVAKGPELARMLDVVLGRRLWLDPGELSPLASGKKDDGLPPGVDEVGRLRSRQGKVDPVRLVRKEAKNAEDEPRWVFSAQTVSHIDAWYEALGERWMRAHFPPVFFREGPRSFLFWHLGALVLLALVTSLGARPFAWIMVGIVGRIARRTKLAWDDTARAGLRPPARLACALPLFFVGSRFLGLYQPADAIVMRVLRALTMVALFWFLLRLVASFGGSVLQSDWGKTRPSLRSFSAFTLRVGRFVVWILGSVAVLSELGFPVGSIITGLGIGGIAIALAAQKTVENLFGSVSILIDQPFRVGDTIRVDGIEGSVETVGLRSTRIRTSDRSLVVLPNGKLADMRIESLSARDRTRFGSKLRVTPHATEPQLIELVALLSDALAKHPKVRAEDVLVRLSALVDGAFEVDVSCAVETTKLQDFADVRQQLLLACIASMGKAGLEMAAPREPPPAPPV